MINIRSSAFVFCIIGIFLVAPQVALAEISPLDSDNDGLTDEQEKIYYTDPQNPDTDGDSFTDGTEVLSGYSPLFGEGKAMHQVDSDIDGLNDLLEVTFATDLKKIDTDGDAISDYEEVMKGTDPLSVENKYKFKKRLEADLTKQRLYFFVDEKLVLNMGMSSGNPRTPTPPGNYKVMYKVPVMRYRGADYDLPNVKWNLAFRPGGYFLHTAYWHNDFGIRTRSHGCINLAEKDAAILYKYIDVGTAVSVVGKTPKNRMAVI